MAKINVKNGWFETLVLFHANTELAQLGVTAELQWERSLIRTMDIAHIGEAENEGGCAITLKSGKMFVIKEDYDDMIEMVFEFGFY